METLLCIIGESMGVIPGSTVGASLSGKPNFIHTAGCFRENCCKIESISFTKACLKTTN